MTRFPTRLLYVYLIALILGWAAPRAISSGVVISQVYGGGGNSGATDTHDFVELPDRESVAVNLSGWSVQYASSAGSSRGSTAVTGTIGPGGYFLTVQKQCGPSARTRERAQPC